MPNVVKKENLVISIREYQDNQGQTKKVWKNIGELITWQGDDGSQYQSFEMWGPTGSTKGKVFENQQDQAMGQMQQPQQPPQQPAPQPYGHQNGYAAAQNGAPQNQIPQQAPNPNAPPF